MDGSKIAEVDDQAILASDLQKYAGRELSIQRENLYKLEKQKLEEYISAFLLTQEAKKRGVSVEAVLDQEVNSKILPVEDDEIEVFYKSNKARIAVDLDKAGNKSAAICTIRRSKRKRHYSSSPSAQRPKSSLT